MSDLLNLKAYLINKIQDDLYLDNNIENERSQIIQLFKQTVELGESNSALLIGPNDVAKTKFIDDILDVLRAKKTFSSNVILVRLNGLLHTDDRLALKSITTQMNLDNAMDGKVFGSFADNLAFLLACLKTGDRESSKSVLFILDEFDLFCGHHNQTLLYNLFDVSQSAQAPICVFGITSRLDVIELFEKRVKSRFSHRQYFLIPSDDINHRMEKIENILSIQKNKKVKISESLARTWNAGVKSLMNKKFKNLMQRCLDTDLGYQKLKNMLMVLVSSLDKRKTALTLDDFEKYLNKTDQDESIQLIQDLSVLELCLLIAMKHHSEIYDNQPMNFEMILARYLKFVNSSPNIQNVQRPVVLKAFEHIQNINLISAVSSISSGKLQKEYHMFTLEVTPQQIAEAVSKSAGLPTNVTQWAVSSLV